LAEIGPLRIPPKNRALQHKITYRARDAVTGKNVRQLGETVTEMRRLLEGPPVHDLFVGADGKTVILAGGRWVYTFETGKVDVYDPLTGRFVPIHEMVRAKMLENADSSPESKVRTVWNTHI
jgi:hypothetical protein